LTPSGVFPGPKLLNAASGIIVSCTVLTDAPLEALDLPLAARALMAALRAELAFGADAAVLAVPAADLATADVSLTVPVGACVVCVPLADPPAVLT
jgi:hypothetical protein